MGMEMKEKRGCKLWRMTWQATSARPCRPFDVVPPRIVNILYLVVAAQVEFECKARRKHLNMV